MQQVRTGNNRSLSGDVIKIEAFCGAGADVIVIKCSWFRRKKKSVYSAPYISRARVLASGRLYGSNHYTNKGLIKSTETNRLSSFICP
jgi:hypothetical protein